MALHNRVLFWAMMGLGGLFCGCGGNVDVSAGGQGGGGSGGSAGAGLGGAGTAGTSSAQGGTGVAGAGQGGTTMTSAQGGAAGAGSCDGLQEVGCLGAFPDCVPIYDDACCPSCDAGGCADCVDIHFHHCTSSILCKTEPDFCGILPPWACSGGQADCNIDPGGSKTPCATVAGCTPAYCSLDMTCDTDPICHPVTKNTCTILCKKLPPPCPPGTYAEGDGSCYTGLCVPENLCVIGL